MRAIDDQGTWGSLLDWFNEETKTLGYWYKYKKHRLNNVLKHFSKKKKKYWFMLWLILKELISKENMSLVHVNMN